MSDMELDLGIETKHEARKRRGREASRRYAEKHQDRIKEYRKRLWSDNPDKIRKWCKQWQEIPSNRMTVLVRCRIWKAKKKGWPFDEAALREFVKTVITHCQICGVELDFKYGKGKSPKGPSIDRVDNEKGYIAGNLAILCNRCNSLKGSATATEHRRFAEFIERYSNAE